MFKRFIPTWKIESIYDLTPQEVKNHGIKAILTDLDNTLIAWNNPDGTPELRNWLKVMREESIPVIVVSNNNHRRIKRAVERFKPPFPVRLKRFADARCVFCFGMIIYPPKINKLFYYFSVFGASIKNMLRPSIFALDSTVATSSVASAKRLRTSRPISL